MNQAFNTLQKALLTALEQSDRNQLTQLFKSCPSANLQNALLFLEAGQDVYDLAALDCMATSFVHGGDLETGRAFAGACVQLALELYDAGTALPEKDLLIYLGNCTYLLQKLLLDSGSYAEAIELYKAQALDKTPGWESPQFIGTHLQAAENYFENNQPDTAISIINNIPREQVAPASVVLYDRLQFKLKNLTAGVHQSPEDVAKFKKEQQVKDLRGMLDALKEVMKGYEDEVDLPSLEKLVQAVEQDDADTDMLLLELSRKISHTILQTQKKMSGVDTADTIQHKRYELNEAIAFLQEDEQTKEALENAIETLNKLMTWFKERDLYSDVAFTAWNIYSCYDLLELYPQAADTLEIIYTYLAKQRTSITDIQKRAGVFKQYPHLFTAMAFCNYMSGNANRLFHRIEASKARNLQDRVLALDGKNQQPVSADGLKDALTKVLALNNAHYLTLLVAPYRTYAVLLTKQGRLFATANGEGDTALKTWLQKDYASPETWNAPRSGLFGKKNRPDIPNSLGQFIKPIELAEQEGLIDAGDHLVFSPDGVLNIFPLHMARFSSGQYLVEKYSVSKIHGGQQLLHLLQQPKLSFNKKYSVTCPAKQDADEKALAFYDVEKWLEQRLNALKQSAEISQTAGAFNTNSFYHLATHGVFPQPGAQKDLIKQNPYYNSGLLLKVADELPGLLADGKYYDDLHLLSPKKLYESAVDLSGCHISMQACVSGRSMQGYGGDALGLEWAFFYAGVTSMISANWNIDVNWSNKIFERLYDGWFMQGNTLAQAHRSALLATLNEAPLNETLPREYFWAGLSLTGDFR